MNKFIEFDSGVDFWSTAVEYIGNLDGLSLGVSGGSAGEIVTKLENDSEIFLVDERMVDYNSEFCNCRQLRELDDSLRITCMKHDEDFQLSLPYQLDIAVMGIGSDGHFASLFEKSDFSSKEVIVETETDNHEIKKRISLSMNYLLKTSKVLFLLKGESKKSIWDKLKNNQVGGLPIGYFMDNFDGEILFLYLK